MICFQKVSENYVICQNYAIFNCLMDIIYNDSYEGHSSTHVDIKIICYFSKTREKSSKVG